MESTERTPSHWAASFFPIWTGQALSLLGSRLAQFALVWWLTEKTGSATVLATATLVALLPGVLAGPFVGALVDRWNRRVVMIVADSLVALAAAGLAALFWTETVQVWHVYGIMLARGIGGTFHFPAMSASTSLMVPKEQLPRVAGLNQTLQGALNVAAPPLGALLLAVLPMEGIMGIDVLTAAFAVTPLLFVHIPQPRGTTDDPARTPRKPSLLRETAEGFRYLRRWPGLLAVLILAMLLNFFASPAFSLMPLLVTTHFQGEALQLAWLNSAQGFGLLSGGVLLGIWGGFRRRINTALMGIVGLGLGAFLVGITPAAVFPMALAALFFGAAMNALANGSFSAVLQTSVAPEMQGRVFTVANSMAAGIMPISLAIAGPAADAVGIRTLFVVAGLSLAVMGLASFAVPVILRLEDSPQVSPSSEAGAQDAKPLTGGGETALPTEAHDR